MYPLDKVVKNPKYMLIGDMPGKDDAREGHLFSGRTGAQLNRIMNAVGMDREECYETTVLPERPIDNSFKSFYVDAGRNTPTGQLTDAWQRVDAKISQVKPRVCIVFGDESLRAVCGLQGIMRWRGSILEYKGISTIPVLHPHHLLKQAFGEKGAWLVPATCADFERAQKVAKGVEKVLRPKLILEKSSKRLETYLSGLSAGCYEVAFDIETERKTGWIKCIGFTASTGEGVVVPFPNCVSDPEQMRLKAVIQEYATNGRIKWIGQNAYNFDIPHIQKMWGFRWDNLHIDTMVLHHMLYPELPHTLALITSLHTTIPYYKNTSGDNLYLYNASDVAATLMAAQELEKEARKLGMWDLWMNYYRLLLPQFSTMTMRGLRVDKEYQKKMKKEFTAEAKVSQKALDDVYRKYGGEINFTLRLQRLQMLEFSGKKTTEFQREKNDKGKNKKKRVVSLITALEKLIIKKESLNVRSTKDLAYFLYNVLELPKKTKKGKLTTDKGALNQLYLKTGHEFLRNMIELRHVKNMISRWGNLKTDEDGTIGTTYSFAETGRLRSGKFEAK